MGDLLFEERQTKETELRLIDFEVTLLLAKDQNISETLTAIRIAQGVATATQQDPAKKGPSGRSQLDVKIRFVPEAKTPVDQVKEIADTLRLKGVRTIRIDTRENAPVLRKGGKKYVVAGPG